MTTPIQGLVCPKCNKNVSELVSKGKRCRECDRKFFSEYRSKNSDKIKETMRKFRFKHKYDLKLYLSNRRKNLIASMDYKELTIFRTKECEKSKKRALLIRNEVFGSYGGWKCKCCGETEKVFLTIDHINNDGAIMRKSGIHPKGGTSFYAWLRKNNFPEGFQVLCMNCQFGKKLNNGICPHQTRCDGHLERE